MEDLIGYILLREVLWKFQCRLLYCVAQWGELEKVVTSYILLTTGYRGQRPLLVTNLGGKDPVWIYNFLCFVSCHHVILPFFILVDVQGEDAVGFLSLSVFSLYTFNSWEINILTGKLLTKSVEKMCLL